MNIYCADIFSDGLWRTANLPKRVRKKFICFRRRSSPFPSTREALTGILGNVKKTPFEQRVLNGMMFISAILTSLIFFESALFGISIKATVLLVLSSALFWSLYLAGRKAGHHSTIFWIYLVANYSVILADWLFVGGHFGVAMSVLIILTGILPIISPERQLVRAVASTGILFLTLILSTYIFQDLYPLNITTLERSLDKILETLILSAGLMVITFTTMRSYHNLRMNLQLVKEKPVELNRLKVMNSQAHKQGQGDKQQRKEEKYHLSSTMYQAYINSGEPSLRVFAQATHYKICGTPVDDHEAHFKSGYKAVTDGQYLHLDPRKLTGNPQNTIKPQSISLVAAGVAHDLKNILSALVTYPQLLLLDLSKEHEMRQPLETIRDSGINAKTLVEDFLNLTTRKATSHKHLELNLLVEQFFKGAELTALRKHHPKVLFQKNLANRPMYVDGSRIHLQRVLMNLVTNAAESISGKGTVQIETSSVLFPGEIRGAGGFPSGKYTRLRISDTGLGISKRDLKYICEPFFTTKSLGRSGSGLGMTVVRSAVEDHGGYMEIKSKKMGGTAIIIYLPEAGSRTCHNTPDTHPSFQDRGTA